MLTIILGTCYHEVLVHPYLVNPTIVILYHSYVRQYGALV